MTGIARLTQPDFILASFGIKELIPWIGMVLGGLLFLFLVISLFKKGDRGRAVNCRGITLLAVLGKCFVYINIS